MNYSRVYWLTCVLTILLANAVPATTIVMPTDDQLLAKSPLIVEGSVLRVQPIEQDGRIWTEVIVSVSRVLKGSAPETVTIREAGGVIDDRITKIFGAPEYREGEHVLLFLTPTPRGDFQTTDLFVGKFAEEKMMNGRRLWFRNDEPAGGVNLLDAELRPIHPRNVQRDGQGFERFIADRLAGRPAAKNYGVENPILERYFAVRDGRRVVEANFTLISEPTLYRWFAFDNGTTVRWYSNGSQPGYSGGGVGELESGMAAWTGYSAARISYTYSGTTTTRGGLQRGNGVNEVLFNDPLGEIAGSWSPSSGGVVGTGGFNGVTNGGTWTAPFAADAQHTQRSYAAYNITEGNLTIQDNVTPTAGISSSRLAEIIAHEFGHTLGFGHSSEGNALMYATITGLGPSLRPDDQLAARWLYPSGSASPPPPAPAPPAAPSNLSGSLSGSNVLLQWTDNATNETGQSIYVAAGSGSFVKVADVGAGQTSATLTGFTSGSYRIYVVAFNGSGSSSASNTVTITVNAPVSAAFSVSPTGGVAGQTTFYFTDQSTGSVTSRLWQFGDGTTSTAANPAKMYGAAGTYTATLTVSGDTQSSASRTITVTAPQAALVAAFSFSPQNPTTDQTVAFTDQTTGGATSWLWQFGDGTTSSERNPSRRFVAPGGYNVTLTAYRNGEAASVSRSLIVSSGVPATPSVSAAFDIASVSANVGQVVAFGDRSSGSPTRWSWSFGDGNTSSAQHPAHVYSAPGTYLVTLTASNSGSTSSTSRTIAIHGVAPPAFRSLVSVTAQTNGVGGSVWRTELTLFNAASDGATLMLSFIPGAGVATQSRSIYLAPRQSVTYANALLDIFGISSGAGGLAIEATGGAAAPNIKVSSRTFTNGGLGTYGQAVPDVESAELGQTLFLTGLASNATFRTNIGMVNRSGAPASATLTLHNSSGATVAVANVSMAANNFQQAALASYFPGLGAYESLSMRVAASAANALSVYASVVDNRTQDPIYIQGIPAPVATRVTLPSVGRLPGANGTFWRSDVTLFNPAAYAVTLQLRYLASGADNRTATSRNVVIGGGETIVLADIAAWFGYSAGSGALEVTALGGAAPVVTSRTYTTDAAGGTYGQSIDPVRTFAPAAYVAGLRSDASFRSNAGFVNGSDETIGVTATLVGASGQVLGNAFVTLAPRSQVQYSLAALFPGVNVSSLGSVTLQATTPTAALFAYGSIIDNASGDPVFFAGE